MKDIKMFYLKKPNIFALYCTIVPPYAACTSNTGIVYTERITIEYISQNPGKWKYEIKKWQ